MCQISETLVWLMSKNVMVETIDLFLLSCFMFVLTSWLVLLHESDPMWYHSYINHCKISIWFPTVFKSRNTRCQHTILTPPPVWGLGAQGSQRAAATVYLFVITALWFPGHGQQQPTAGLIDSEPNRRDESHESTCQDMNQHTHSHTWPDTYSMQWAKA